MPKLSVTCVTTQSQSNGIWRSIWILLLIFYLPSDRVKATTLTAFRRPAVATPIRTAVNRDSKYGPWLKPTEILYRLESSYTATEATTIHQAMAQIQSDTGGCINFRNFVPGTDAGTDHIYIGKTLNSGESPPTCLTFPGRVLTQSGHGQKVALFGTTTTNGCLNTVRDAMKYLVHVLGLRSEHNRPDRDRFINVFPENISPELQSLDLLKQYNAAQIDYLPIGFDFDSVTIPEPTKYAKNGSLLYTPIMPEQGFGTLPRLSKGDCIGLALQYTGCSLASCQDPYESAGTIIDGEPLTISPIPVTKFPIQVKVTSRTILRSPKITTVPTIFSTSTSPRRTSSTSSVGSSSTPAPVSLLCEPNFKPDAVWNDYSAHKLYFISDDLVFVVQNGQIVENGIPMSIDFPGATPSLPLIAGYYAGGSVFLVDQSKDTYLYINNAFVSQTTGTYPALSAAMGYGNIVMSGQDQNPNLAVTLYVDENGAISSVGINPSSSPKNLASLFTTNVELVNDLSSNGVQEMYSLIDASGTEKIAFLYQPTGKPLQYFDAIPCVPTTVLDAFGQVCLTLSTGPRNFASTISACNISPFS
ncbi:hypothetical protein BV898_01197 [Hypsibius exemplaris]|uniref:Peptidase M12A domain-containing protein n=1 Tax=Hypsibius exemplaris TaxID=2072580 RepID=A0A1W0XBV9_HYPEX|nr:hypothetical protein BV898_01197 [Hypsibius exemplaris]